jgi:magnesium-transporting ATPase (P-type)
MTRCGSGWQAVVDVVNAAIIALIVLCSVVLHFVQTSRSQHAAARLREEVAPTATVVREGDGIDMPRRELVPGDVIRHAAGDRVPADAPLARMSPSCGMVGIASAAWPVRPAKGFRCF